MLERRQKIMVVDDSDIVREVTAMNLESHGYEVVLIESVFGFTSALKREQPDLVLLDVSMPALEGDALVTIVHRHGVFLCPIVFHSDRPESELKELVERVGASGYIRKTPNGKQLVQEIESFLPRQAG